MLRDSRFLLAAFGVAAVAMVTAMRSKDTFPVTIVVDASHVLGDVKPAWRFFGCDEPNYATMKNGSKLIRELGKLGPQQVYFRTHNLLTTGDGKPSLKWGSTNVYTEGPNGEPRYDWKIVDGIFDTYLKSGIRPYVQIGFMPEALSVHPQPYRHSWTPTAPYDQIYTGWSYPPKDFAKWGEVVYQWAKHCVDKYGRAEVERWYWEVWNEPNIGYWRGTKEDFFKLHDVAIAAVRRALPTARVGGPDTAGYGGKFMEDFVGHCLQAGTPLDFISFHAKGAPTYVDGHVRMGISNQLREIDRGFNLVASNPALKDKPIVIGESDPEGCAACQGPQLGYRNGTMYSSYTAACMAREYELMDRHKVNFEGALTWAFEFEDQPYFAGFRALTTNGIDLPVLNVFRMYGKMGGKRVEAKSTSAVLLDEMLRDGVRKTPDVSAMASLDKRRLSVVVWHYHDDDVAGPDAAIELHVKGLTNGAARLTHYRIDNEHSNSYTEWQKMGSPEAPTQDQIAKLEKAGGLATLGPRTKVEVTNGEADLKFDLPRQGVSLLVLEW